MQHGDLTELANRGRLIPEGTAGLVIFLVAIAVVLMIVYGRRSRKRVSEIG
ncbi:hypothetical protein ACIA8F_12715 [Streptomyces sp. NPDC051563]|uniref:hypothetical protein n=1 Tax=Streptomyces sp. NPDC051563 TaxID=3365659 RepID=UPI0037B548F7